MSDPEEEDRQRFTNLEPKLRDEVGGILERAFRREGGDEPDAVNQQHFSTLASEAEANGLSASRMAEEAAEEARLAAERYAMTHSLEDLEAVQNWEAEAASYRREAEAYQEEAERLRKYLPG